MPSRSLLAYGYGLREPGKLVRASIGFVADTYETDPQASRELLAKVFEEERLQRFAPVEVPAICDKIRVIADVDPGFAVEIYGRTYGFVVTESCETQMGSSRILPLMSNTRQDYSMARYVLEEFIFEFLGLHPCRAVEALVVAVDGYVERAHPIAAEGREAVFSVGGRRVRLRPDFSHIWAHSPARKTDGDGGVLIAKFLEVLRGSAESVAVGLGDLLIEKGSLAVLWSRLFLAAAERGGALLKLARPVAMREEFLVCLDTRKDAIDVVAAGFESLSRGERADFERGAFEFDCPDEARDHLLRRLFSTIGPGALVTPEARRVVRNTEPEPRGNERPFVFTTSWGPAEGDEGATDLTERHPDNPDLTAAIRATETRLEVGAEPGGRLALGEMYALLRRVEGFLDAARVGARLRAEGEEVIVRACGVILERRLLPPGPEGGDTEDFLHFLRIGASSRRPEVDEDTECRSEDVVSWGSPAPRVP